MTNSEWLAENIDAVDDDRCFCQHVHVAKYGKHWGDWTVHEGGETMVKPDTIEELNEGE